MSVLLSQPMVRRFLPMQRWMLVTDVLMLLYWLVTALSAVQLIDLPQDYLFKDYFDQRVVAWNWSFFPLDIVLACSGIYAVYLFRRSDPTWFAYAVFSAALTFCAGLMALSYWAWLGQFDWSWWLPNLLLMLWPLWFLPRLLGAFAEPGPA